MTASQAVGGVSAGGPSWYSGLLGGHTGGALVPSSSPGYSEGAMSFILTRLCPPPPPAPRRLPSCSRWAPPPHPPAAGGPLSGRRGSWPPFSCLAWLPGRPLLCAPGSCLDSAPLPGTISPVHCSLVSGPPLGRGELADRALKCGPGAHQEACAEALPRTRLWTNE